MRTALIRIAAPREGQRGYQVQLFCDSNGERWLEHPLASATIPESLSPPDPPRVDGEPATPDRIRRFLLTQSEPSTMFSEIGAYLYGLVARGAVHDQLENLANRFPGEGGGEEGLRVLFEIEPVELRLLPWELMRGDGPLPLFADERNPHTRTRGFALQKKPPPCAPVLRLLVVVGAGPEDEVVQSEKELAGLREALRRVWGLVDFEVLDRPTQKELEARYRELKPHVFHFIGHGMVGETGPELDIAPRDGREGWAWPTTAIRADLQSWRPRLVILNACRSIELSEQEGAWQIADAFAELQVPAVLGMQADVRGDAAAAFAGALYAALADDRSLDVALSMARVAMSHVVGWDERDPYLPCLTLSMPPEWVMPTRHGLKEDQRKQIERTSAFVGARRFVDRSLERRQLWRTISGGDAGAAEPAVLAVMGDANVGKTELVRWCVASAALSGANVAYVDLRLNGRLDFRAVLSAVGEQLIASLVHRDGNRAAFQGFIADLSRLGLEAEDAIETIFDDFHECLRAAASEAGPLIVALDHVDAVEPAHWTAYVSQYLLRPIAEGALPVGLIIVVDRSKIDDTLAPELRSIVSTIEVPELPQGQYEELARLYLRTRGFRQSDFDEVVTVLAGKVPPLWNAEQFRLLDQTARALRWQPEPA